MRTIPADTPNGRYLVHVDSDDAGTDWTVIFLHGTGLNTAPERRMFAPAFAGRVRCVWFDQLGCGESRPTSASHLSWDHNVEDVARIAERFSRGPTCFVGHSAGAKVIDDLVRRHRSLVAGAVWISAADSIELVARSVIAKALRRTPDVEGLTASRRHDLQTLASALGDPFGREQVTQFLEAMGPLRVFELYWSDATAAAVFGEAMAEAPLSADVFIQLYDDYFRRSPIAPPDYSGIPLLVVYSPDDQVTEWERHGAVLTASVPHASVRAITNGGHFVHLQKPSETADAIIEFLGSRADPAHPRA